MTALVLTPFTAQQNPLHMARQEWRLAQKHYRDVCGRYDARLPESVEQFRAALERRERAFGVYMRALRGE